MINSDKNMYPKQAEKLQDKIYSEMPIKRKLEVLGQMFSLGQKLKNSKPYKIKKQFKDDNTKHRSTSIRSG